MLDAAQELLETLPPSKVTRAAVARRAGVDPSLIRYYFSDRSSLLLAVVKRIVEDHTRAFTVPPGDTAAERLRALVRMFFEMIATHPYLHRLLVEEIAHAGSAEAREAFHQMNQGAINGYQRILKQGAKDGTLRKADPVLLHVAVIGMSEFFFEARVLFEDALGKSAAPQALAKRYAGMIADMVVDGLGRE